MSDLIMWFYSDGDVFMAQLKLVVVLMFLDFGLSMLSVVADGIGSAS